MRQHGTTRPIASHREIVALERERAAARLRTGGGVHVRANRVPAALRRSVFARDGHSCVWCGADNALVADHVWPHITGGSLTLDNLQTLCGECNRWKWLYEVELVRVDGQLYARKLPFAGKVAL